jgi:hypothetical protein
MTAQTAAAPEWEVLAIQGIAELWRGAIILDGEAAVRDYASMVETLDGMALAIQCMRFAAGIAVAAGGEA